MSNANNPAPTQAVVPGGNGNEFSSEPIGVESTGLYMSASELVAVEYPPTRWVVKDLIPHGLTLLAGAPKIGKSFLCLDLALSVTQDESALGVLETRGGKVFYLAFEDVGPRLQHRINKMLGPGAPPPESLLFPRDREVFKQHSGGVEKIVNLLSQDDELRLVIVDTLQSSRPVYSGSNRYKEDYEAVEVWKKLADDFDRGIVLVHHTRKASEVSDVLERVSGSYGLSGAADTLIIMGAENRMGAYSNLLVTGRDLRTQEYVLERDETSMRSFIREGVHAGLSSNLRVEIQSLLASVHPGTRKPSEIAEELGHKTNNVQQVLGKMLNAGEIEKVEYGQYRSISSPQG